MGIPESPQALHNQETEIVRMEAQQLLVAAMQYLVARGAGSWSLWGKMPAKMESVWKNELEPVKNCKHDACLYNCFSCQGRV